MPGAPRFFADNAARQRAYRRRKRDEIAAEREEAGATSLYAHVLQEAIEAARKHGDPLAQEVYRRDAFDTLRALAEHFHDRADTPPAERPWRK